MDAHILDRDVRIDLLGWLLGLHAQFVFTGDFKLLTTVLAILFDRAIAFHRLCQIDLITAI